MKKTILIVDDEPNIVILMEYLMKHAGYEVVTACDGQQALDYLAENSPSLMILDVFLPYKNGFEVCEEVRADNRFADMPILMLTAKGNEAEMNKGFSLGADAYITKPFSTHDLVGRVNSLL
jgi:two-component system alkaline phosphatase synthesis response regulator PhoP